MTTLKTCSFESAGGHVPLSVLLTSGVFCIDCMTVCAVDGNKRVYYVLPIIPVTTNTAEHN